MDEEFDDGSGGSGGPDDDEEEDDSGGGMCSLDDDEELDSEAADWLAAHPGADMDDFIADKTARHTAATKKKEIAETDAKLAQIEKDIKRIDERLADMDETIRKPVKNWADMTNQERGEARKQMTKAWRHLNPKGDPAQLTAILNRLDNEPGLSPVDMMTYVIGETVLGLPGGIAQDRRADVARHHRRRQRHRAAAQPAANYWEDVVTGKALDRLDTMGAKIVSGLSTANDYYGSQSASQILADYKAVMKASGQTVQNVTVAQVEQARQALAKLEQAAITGDAPAIAKVSRRRRAGRPVFEWMTGAAAGKAVKVGKGGLQMLQTKADRPHRRRQGTQGGGGRAEPGGAQADRRTGHQDRAARHTRSRRPSSAGCSVTRTPRSRPSRTSRRTTTSSSAPAPARDRSAAGRPAAWASPSTSRARASAPPTSSSGSGRRTWAGSATSPRTCTRG